MIFSKDLLSYVNQKLNELQLSFIGWKFYWLNNSSDELVSIYKSNDKKFNVEGSDLEQTSFYLTKLNGLNEEPKQDYNTFLI